MARLARAGLTARACVYLLLAALVIALAFGDYTNEPDQQGALQALTHHTGGVLLVWLITIGLFGYALWRFSEAAFGVAGDGRKVGPRLKSLARGLIYLFFAITAVRVAAGSNAGSQAQRQELWTAKAMQHAGGRWIVGIVGVVIVVCGVALVAEGRTRRFEKYLELGRLSPTQRRVVEALGVTGTAARGVVFALAGVFVVVAAVTATPSKAGGLDQAFRELLALSAGPVLVFLTGVGLMIFAAYGFAEAKWHRT